MTECSTQLSLLHLLKIPVTVDFEGGNITSDSGVMFLRQADNKLDLTAQLAGAVVDRRDPIKVKHQVYEQLRQRIYQICAGYEDANDANTLRRDPALKIAVGRAPEGDEDLASQSTLSRLENRIGKRELQRMNKVLLESYLAHRTDHGGRIVLDFDSTDDPTHGQQEFSFFHGFYDQHMYHPLLCFDGETGELIGAELRPGNVHAAKGVVKMLRRLVRAIRQRWPKVEIVVRADAGFCVPRLYRFCEKHRIGYVIGLIGNRTLWRLHEPLLAEALARFEKEEKKVRLLGEVGYRAGSWGRFRRVVMKAEAMSQGTNKRFVVTNCLADPEMAYSFYTQRGDMENRIKDLKVALGADRLSCHRFEANRFRFVLHAAAYVLMHTLRTLLGGTELEVAQFDTLRLRLLKVGARVRQTARRVWVHLSSAYPYAYLWKLLHQRLWLEPAPG